MQPMQSVPLAHINAGLPLCTAGSAPVNLCDLSALQRVGFRGRQAAAWLQAQGFCLPDAPNQAIRQEDGSWVARLSLTEYLLLAPVAASGARLDALEKMPGAAGCYLLPRRDSHAWLSLSGDAVPQMMAKLCAVDLANAAFAPGAIAQTSVARAGAMVINASSSAQPLFWLLVDSTLAAYFWSALTDAMAEFGGSPYALLQ